MSADRQRLTRSIQRIAESAPSIRKLLNDAENKGGKPRSAGVGGGAGSEEGSNTINETRICCDGSVSDDPNPGVDERDTTDGDQDGLNPDDPADIGDLAGGCLTGVTNCDTGEVICFCGDDFIPPDGWENPNEPPIDPDYQEGTYYSENADGSGDRFQLPLDAATYIMNQDPDCPGDCFLYDYVASGSSAPQPWVVTYTTDGGSDLRSGSFWERFCDDDTFINPTCDLPPPLLEEEWPSDGCTNLAIKGGAIVGSKYDPENDGSYSAPRSEIPICDGANSMYLAPSGSQQGGWKTINSTREAGYLYNSKFEQIAHIDGNQYSDPSV